ncbi:MAG TPA: anti-sigma factor [Actinomycetota bacterium]|nr:anti-sigma factor [Actinomycetota bacterium]
MSHSELEELAAGYVLGALEPDDEHAFQRHLEGCPTCQATVRELEAVVGELAYSSPPVDPPDTVWAGIRRQIKPEARRGAVPGPAPTAAPAPDGPQAVPGGQAPAGRGLRLLPGLAAAAAILLVVVLSLWNLNLRDENAVYRDRVAALERATQLANDPTANLVALNDTPGAPPGAQAAVIASTREDRGVLLVENLPPLQRGRVYELWGVPEGDFDRAEKAVVFVPLRRTGTQTLQFEVPIQPGTVFAITDEPAPDGSQKPTTKPLLSGSAATA